MSIGQPERAANLPRESDSGPAIASILVPLDGSAASEEAIPYAAAVARRTGARLTLAHVSEAIDAHEGPADAYPDALLSDARLTGLEVRSELLHGPVSDSLLANAEATRADLIVMTSSGRGGISRALFGSVADALVRRTEIPVLLVRPLPDAHSVRTPSSPRPIRRVLLPLDGSDAAERIIPHAIALAGTDGVHYLLLRVHPALTADGRLEPGPIIGQRVEPGGDGYLSTMSARLAALGALVSTRAEVHASNADTILKVAADERVDLIAMTTRGAGSADRMIFGSVADVVLRRAPSHVLVYRPPVKDVSA